MKTRRTPGCCRSIADGAGVKTKETTTAGMIVSVICSGVKTAPRERSHWIQVDNAGSIDAENDFPMLIMMKVCRFAYLLPWHLPADMNGILSFDGGNGSPGSHRCLITILHSPQILRRPPSAFISVNDGEMVSLNASGMHCAEYDAGWHAHRQRVGQHDGRPGDQLHLLSFTLAG